MNFIRNGVVLLPHRRNNTKWINLVLAFIILKFGQNWGFPAPLSKRSGISSWKAARICYKFVCSLQRGEKKAGPFLSAFQKIAVFLKGYLLFRLQKA